MLDNAVTFFERYKTDEPLRERVKEAIDAYPGSLEIREALVEAIVKQVFCITAAACCYQRAARLYG